MLHAVIERKASKSMFAHISPAATIGFEYDV